MNKIIRQAIEQVTHTVAWVYSEWEDGRITKYRSEYTEGIGYSMGFEQEVKVKPLGLNWTDTTTTK